MLAFAARGEKVDGFGFGDGVVDVAEVDGFDELMRLHLGEELPERFVFGAGVEIPHCVDEGSAGEMDDAFLRAEPAELGVVAELP